MAPSPGSGSGQNIQNVAKAKLIGRAWYQKQQKNVRANVVTNHKLGQTSSYEILSTPSTTSTTSSATASTAATAKKKYKKKKHSLSSPSLGKYSPMLLRKVFQQNKEFQSSKFEEDARLEDACDDYDYEETVFSRLWASEASGTLHGEERSLAGGSTRKGETEEAFTSAERSVLRRSGENKNNFLFGRTFSVGNGSGSCSLAVNASSSLQESLSSVPPKKKKKSIIASLSLGQKDLPKKIQQNFANSQIWNRRQPVKKTRKSVAGFLSTASLISQPIREENSAEDPASVSLIHCTDRECCCHARKDRDAGECSVCKEVRIPRKKSSLLSRLPLPGKRPFLLKGRMIAGKSTVRMNSEPILGKQPPKKKLSATDTNQPSGLGPRTGLVPRRDFGPAAGHHGHHPRAPMLKFSRGSWLSKPTEEENSPETSIQKKLTSILTSSSSTKTSSRRHSAPPTSRRRLTVTFFASTDVTEIVEKGTINRRLLKLVQEKKVSPYLITSIKLGRFIRKHYFLFHVTNGLD